MISLIALIFLFFLIWFLFFFAISQCYYSGCRRLSCTGKPDIEAEIDALLQKVGIEDVDLADTEDSDFEAHLRFLKRLQAQAIKEEYYEEAGRLQEEIDTQNKGQA